MRVCRYEIIKTLGEGRFGKVKLATNIETKEIVAVKILDKDQIKHQNMGRQVKTQITIMKQLKHPNVVRMKEVLKSESKFFIVIEYISGGELFTELVKKGYRFCSYMYSCCPPISYFAQMLSSGKFGEDEASRYFRQMIDGISYCHYQGVCHRDLKVNLFLCKGVICIYSYELAVCAQTAGKFAFGCGKEPENI